MQRQIEKRSGKKAVSIIEDEYGFELKTMRNGHQWSGFPVDAELLDLIVLAITEFHKTTKKVKINAKPTPRRPAK